MHFPFACKNKNGKLKSKEKGGFESFTKLCSEYSIPRLFYRIL